MLGVSIPSHTCTRSPPQLRCRALEGQPQSLPCRPKREASQKRRGNMSAASTDVSKRCQAKVIDAHQLRYLGVSTKAMSLTNDHLPMADHFWAALRRLRWKGNGFACTEEACSGSTATEVFWSMDVAGMTLSDSRRFSRF